MAKARTGSKDERLLVLAVDIDNDLYRKTRISGPLVGRAENLEGAKSLALADPEDSDSNAIFYAVKLFDQLKEDGYLVTVATVTGSESEGYNADREMSRQLDMVLETNKSDACILVTDGASDKRILPILQSRIKINSVQVVKMKQAESLENTYFTIIEKLKEPHYSKIVFGLPAVLFLLFAISYSIGLGWVLPVGLIGFYLLVKGFGLEDAFLSSFRGFGFSMDRMSFAFYLSSILFIVAGIFIGFGNYTGDLKITGQPGIAVASGLEGFLLVFPIFLILYLIGRVIDVRAAKRSMRAFKYGSYMGSAIIMWVLLYSFTAWLVGQIYFGQLLAFVVGAIVIGIAVSATANFLRKRVLASKQLKDKPVVNELGAAIGKIAKIDAGKGQIQVNTNYGNHITYSADRIVEISDRVVIR